MTNIFKRCLALDNLVTYDCENTRYPFLTETEISLSSREIYSKCTYTYMDMEEGLFAQGQFAHGQFTQKYINKLKKSNLT